MTIDTVAVVLNFNDARATLECVRSVLTAEDLALVLIVDNCSDPSDRGELENGLERFGSATELILLDSNVGFGGGMNVGIARALSMDAHSVLILNNDTVILPGAVESLRDCLRRRPSVGVAVPVITTGRADTVWSAGGWIDHDSLRTVAHGAGRSLASLPGSLPCNFAPGAALLVRSDVFRVVGGFAEMLFLYVEDLELSLRIASAGFAMEVVRDAVVWHAVQGGMPARSSKSVYYRVRNSLWLARSRAVGVRGSLLLPVVVARGLRTALQTVRANPRLLFSATRHLVHGLAAGFLTRDPGTKLAPTVFPGSSSSSNAAGPP